MVMPENPIPSASSEAEGRWPNITNPDIKAKLIALEGFLGVSPLQDVTWESEQGEITYTGPHKVQTFTTKTITNHFPNELKETLKRTMVARTFESLVGTEGEVVAKQLIKIASSLQPQEDTPIT